MTCDGKAAHEASAKLGGPRASGCRPWRHQSGIALLEVLVASTITGIGAVGLALMLASGAGFIAGEGDNRVAVYLAQQRIEQARALGFASPANAPGTTTETLSRRFQPSSGLSDPIAWTRTTAIGCVSASDYTVSADCTAVPPPPKQVTVSVQSTPGSQVNPRARPVILRTVLTDR